MATDIPADGRGPEAMDEGVNIYGLLHGFWKENDYIPFSTAEIALYFFLLHRMNSRHWRMPVKCATSLVCRSIMVSKQTALSARESLRKRGLITFTKGSGRDNIPSYSLVTDPGKWTDGMTHDKTDGLTDNLTDSKTDGLTHYNIKDINIKDKISFNNNGGEQKLSVDELEKILLADTRWQDSILSLLSGQYRMDAGEIKNQITLFFRQLRCQGTDSREERECRSHFFNWIRKQLKENHDGNIRQHETDRRRGSDVTACPARDYDGAF